MDSRTINRLIAVAARDRLGPLGLVRHRRTRIWYDDRGWSLIVVEFPSGRSPGTYLNVGAMWLWAGGDHWAFDEGSRVYWRADGSFASTPPLGERGWQQHVDFRDVEQFSRDVELLADVAARRVTQLRTEFPSPRTVAARLRSRATRQDESPLWHAFHSGAAAALGGDAAAAGESLTKVVSAPHHVDWEHSLAEQASDLLGLVADPAAARRRIVEMIEHRRRRLNLPTTHSRP
ncbi:hypothetical protein [Virgisporangium aliadipatigenens]|uniref:hypothetical protein n=1 Tax=Virgisporangium aliadipatigenens TaxID=741659 RepID=UPI00194316A4|nr:hypothetical protein [Virgisporangium aliadipatigenens]